MAETFYDVVLLPEPELAARAIGVSEQLQQYDPHFRLDSEACVPHLSLYMTSLDPSGLRAAERHLEGIALDVPQLLVHATEYIQSHGYIDVEYRRTPHLEHLQAEVIRAIDPLRTGDGVWDEAYRAQLQRPSTGVENSRVAAAQQNYRRYGYPAVGNLFRPHMTFTRFTSDEAISTDGLPMPATFDGQFIKIGLYELGDDHGTCVRKVRAFPMLSRE